MKAVNLFINSLLTQLIRAQQKEYFIIYVYCNMFELNKRNAMAMSKQYFNSSFVELYIYKLYVCFVLLLLMLMLFLFRFALLIWFCYLLNYRVKLT